MRSIPWMMAWELLRRGRWSLPAALLGAIAYSLILFAALERAGAIQPEATHFVIMHFVLTLVNMMLFGAAVFAAQGTPARLYTLPAATSTLVAWRLAPAMAVTAIFSAVTTATLNAVFDLGWPVWGPALFLAVAWGAVQATALLAENSAWLPVLVAAIVLAPAAWFKSQYGPTFGQPTTYWRDVTAGDAAVMLTIAAAAYGTAVLGIARNRRGEAPLSIGFVAWLNRVLDRARTTGRAFASPAEAQFWFEWRRKGWVMPTAVAFGMAMSVGGWLIFSRDAGELFDGLVAGGGFLPIVGLLGAVAIGACGSREGESAMGPFRATRPFSTPEMSRAILKTAAKSSFQAWAIWAVPFFVVGVWMKATGRIPAHVDLQEAWWYLPVTLLGPWTAAAVGASLSLTGRPNLLAKALSGSFGAIIGLTVFAELALSDAAQAQFAAVATGGCGIAFLAGTIWVFLAARRRELVERSSMVVAACVWSVLSTFAALGATFHADTTISLYLFLFGLAALVVAPIAAAPLALSWNRTR